MKRITARGLQNLLRKPAAFAKFQMTGQIDTHEPQATQTPLLELLRQIHMRDLVRFQRIILGPSLGYHMNRRNPFRDGVALRRWLEDTTHGPGPGSHLLGFTRKLTTDDLVESSGMAPGRADILRNYPRLMRRPMTPNGMESSEADGPA